jgi:hypothetical protein
MVYTPNENDLRYLELFNELDKRRIEQWRRSKPEIVLEANTKRLKLLIARNLSGKARTNTSQ